MTPRFLDKFHIIEVANVPVVSKTSDHKAATTLPIVTPSLTNLVRLKWRQFQIETIGGYRFRGQERAFVQDAYNGMDDNTFSAINGAQEWVNWRQIPRALQGRIRENAALIVDLGCGPGSSTRILAWYGMPAWRIIGVDFSEDLIGRARHLASSGAFRTAAGERLAVEFIAGSVTEPLHDASGKLLADHSVDYVNSSGVVGHHLSEDSFEYLAKELKRIVKCGSFVALDSGPHLKGRAICRIMKKFDFVLRTRVRSVPFDPRPQLVFQKK
ncbi:putative Class I SAM-dependent methyltransferase [Gammaproteobacteria bacterium]